MKLLSRVMTITTLASAFLSAYLTVQADNSCINLNTASKERLGEIKHIGEKRAELIIKLRPFLSLDDLDRVDGIGPSRISDIKNQGLACVAASSSPAIPSKTQPDLPLKTEDSPLVEKSSLKESLAEIKLEEKPGSSSPLWAALIIAIFSGFAILLLKQKVKS